MQRPLAIPWCIGTSVADLNQGSTFRVHSLATKNIFDFERLHHRDGTIVVCVCVRGTKPYKP